MDKYFDCFDLTRTLGDGLVKRPIEVSVDGDGDVVICVPAKRYADDNTYIYMDGESARRLAKSLTLASVDHLVSDEKSKS
jgi:hypothetical protein